MLTDPRNKGIEHFGGCKLEDRKAFEVWRKKAYKHLEKFVPHIKFILVKLAYEEDDPDEMDAEHSIEKLGEKWDSKYDASVLDHQLKAFIN